jgi:hypothetical protein
MSRPILNFRRPGPNSGDLHDLTTGADLAKIEFQYAAARPAPNVGPLIDVVVLLPNGRRHPETIPATLCMSRLTDIVSSEIAGAA